MACQESFNKYGQITQTKKEKKKGEKIFFILDGHFWIVEETASHSSITNFLMNSAIASEKCRGKFCKGCVNTIKYVPVISSLFLYSSKKESKSCVRE